MSDPSEECAENHRNVTRLATMSLLALFLMASAGCGGRHLPDRILELDSSGRDIGSLPADQPRETDSIWIVNATTGIRSCLAKRTHYEKALGNESAYYAYIDLNDPDYPLVVVECSRDGRVKRTYVHSGSEWEYVTAIDCVTWLGGSCVFVDTHVNPSLGFGFEVDLDTQKMNIYGGCVFTWDRDGRRVAYLREPPHFGTPPEIPSKLMMGHSEICEVPRRIHSELYWHPTEDRLLAFIPPEDGKAGQLVVVDFSSGPKPSVKRFEVKSQDR